MNNEQPINHIIGVKGGDRGSGGGREREGRERGIGGE